MTPEIKDRIRRASKELKLHDIMLYESSFKRPERDPVKLGENGTQEHMREVRYFTSAIATESKAEAGSAGLLQVLVTLGTRVVPDGGEEDRLAAFQIEAAFLVIYEMQSEIDTDCIKAFADNNAVHNVWPFWRQHVFDVVSRGRLPQLEIPLYSGFKM